MASRYAEVVININGANASGTSSPSTGKGKTTPKVKNKSSDDGIKLSTASKIAGSVLSALSIANNAVGSYTGNKVRQQNIATGLSLASVGISLAINPFLGALHLATMTTKKVIDISIEQINSRQESAYKRSYMGNITTSGSRWRN